MAVFRVARARCSRCNKDLRKRISHDDIQDIETVCTCGERLNMPVSKIWSFSYHGRKGQVTAIAGSKTEAISLEAELRSRSIRERLLGIKCTTTLMEFTRRYQLYSKSAGFSRSYANTISRALNLAVDTLGKDTLISDISEESLEKIRDVCLVIYDMKSTSAHTILNTIVAGLSWAIQQGMMDTRPKNYRRTPTLSRERKRYGCELVHGVRRGQPITKSKGHWND